MNSEKWFVFSFSGTLGVKVFITSQLSGMDWCVKPWGTGLLCVPDFTVLESRDRRGAGWTLKKEAYNGQGKDLQHGHEHSLHSENYLPRYGWKCGLFYLESKTVSWREVLTLWPTVINVEMRRTGLHMEEIIKTDSNEQQNNKNSNEEYYDKNM